MNIAQLENQDAGQHAQASCQSPDLADAPNEIDLSGLAPFELTEFSRTPSKDAKTDEVDISLRIELGRASLRPEDTVGLRQGMIVELDRSVGEPVDVYANDRLFGRGEVLVLNDDICVRVIEILSDCDPT